jgi:hypothetical protein
MKRKNKKLCIIGSAPSKSDAPYMDFDYDIWAISGAAYSQSYSNVPVPATKENKWNDVWRVDAFFEMHKRPTFAPKLEVLKSCKRPVVMQKVEHDIPTSEAYPIDEIVGKYGEELTSSIAYMLAYAIHLGYEEIRLYGVIMAHHSEYGRQRPSVKYFLGIAKALGVKIWAPEETQLTSCPWRYGYDDVDEICGKILAKKATIEDDIKNQTKAIEAAQATLWQLKGASITCDNLIAEIKGGIA